MSNLGMVFACYHSQRNRQIHKHALNTNRFIRRCTLTSSYRTNACLCAMALLLQTNDTKYLRCATNILKKLSILTFAILPTLHHFQGVGAFTIIDHEKVVESDLGNNFFVTQESIGKSRAQVVCELLQEMNADVNGDWREEVRPLHDCALYS